MPSQEHRFRSAEQVAGWLLLTCVAILGPFLLMLGWEMDWTRSDLVVFFFAGLWAFRWWGKPFIHVTKDRLVVRQLGRVQHSVALEEIAAVWRKRGQTVLTTRDGAEFAIHHWNFVLSEDARRFEYILMQRVDGREVPTNPLSPSSGAWDGATPG